jgi:hypothetical protein
MDKIFEYKMGLDLYKKASAPIRKREDSIRILIESIKLFNYIQSGGELSDNPDVIGHFEIRIGKMSRIIYTLESKIFTICFPFSIYFNEVYNCFVVTAPTCDTDIDSVMLTLLESFFNQGLHQMSDFETFYYEFSEFIRYECEIFAGKPYLHSELWNIVSLLMSYECGYLRFDHDEKNYIAGYHPVNHLDLFYSDDNAFKIGLENRIDKSEFVKIIDNNQKRYVLERP